MPVPTTGRFVPGIHAGRPVVWDTETGGHAESPSVEAAEAAAMTWSGLANLRAAVRRGEPLPDAAERRRAS